ncbi:MAG TPA: restriction endonuclease [Candidatus Sulfomarinibacteraceae bacterium]|nr:restriction endonuclease [Candidatus Sulfomarinibacteraceae bacterium]
MTVRLELRRPGQLFTLAEPTAIGGAQSPSRMGGAYRAGIALISLLTLMLLLWLGVRWLAQPLWLARLPGVLSESLALVETAGAFTLAVLWAGLGWRHWRGTRRATQRGSGQTVDLENVRSLSPRSFERYVAGLFRQKGYRVVLRGSSGDLGVDLEVTSPVGRRAIVQCKRYQNTVGPDVVRELYGTLIHEQVAWAFLVTTAEISDSAREWAQGKPLTLIDGATLIEIARSLRHSMRN